MANKDGHRRFGNIRQRESGRYQARYPGPDGRMRTAPVTFASKTDADRYLTLIEAQIINGDWTDPERAKVKLGDYAAKWIVQRPGLRPRTIELYERLLRRHIAPHLGGVPLGKLSTPMIRDWRTTLLEDGVSASVTAKAYRLLRAILMTASEDDRIIPRNPCRIRGAGDEKPDERPVLSVAQVFELADLVGRRPVGNIRKVGPGAHRLRYGLRDGEMRTLPQNFPTKEAAEQRLLAMADDGQADVRQDNRLRALILLATFASLRWGELIALQRQDLNIEAGTVTVRRQYLEMDSGKLVLGPPKSRAGSRTVSIPAAILPAIQAHLDHYVADEPTALVCTGANGGVLRRGNFRRASRWAGAVAAIGVPGLHFHDLRHTGNNIAAESGVSLRDLMDRMGQDSVRAAMIYQHGTSKAGRLIAEALNDQITAVIPSDDDDQDDDDGGTAGALVPVA